MNLHFLSKCICGKKKFIIKDLDDYEIIHILIAYTFSKYPAPLQYGIWNMACTLMHCLSGRFC